MVTYQTPKFGGVQGTFQYSFKENTKSDDATLNKQREGSSYSNRYASAAVTGDFGPLSLVAAYEYQNYSTLNVTATNKDKPGHTVYVGGNYDCGFAQTFAMAQYFKGISSTGKIGYNAKLVGAATNPEYDHDGLKGYGLHVGTVVPLSAGKLTVGVYYLDGEYENVNNANVNADLTYIGASARYAYPLSKRTTVYGGAGAYQQKLECGAIKTEQKDTDTQVYFGMTHTF